MPAPVNEFKKALRSGECQFGLWVALANAYTAEICAGAGYDWLLIDGEHAPNDIRSIMSQLQAIEGSSSHAIVRPPVGETWMIKQVLDIGAQTILVPMVESAAQARELVRAVQYAPQGVRGVGAALARASRFNRVSDYLQTAGNEICLLLQVESRLGLAALDEICAVEGVDGVFVGPADLAADLGYIGRPGEPEVQRHIEAALRKIISHGKAAGILTADSALAKSYVSAGAAFVAIGTDVGLLATGSRRLLEDFKKVS
ncbi:4-hydroxy-2-oxoheptanedioate aldolase [Acetobacter tropicalis]|uniref:2,4-dihydroxyhept-2-ene-1,7-dioic acid aldolase n=1 Tax=Acetobacter tropicalis TaxID=104102 RepID=A0A095B240_9PROT|nr:4-hydroxy-2-oxoheptanedioate aldolase [Acetobacter tropicalis]KAA8390656.1 4-hydroxy-2-oxoheptanedioate aldolase [Acetobacter tropicalis]KAA8393280.1 4-hydroxy-2-oxoheptanedioate aldolase [Acetobacter tropicalis]KGB23048.1 2,4-dihydroxyhept-2-ene-1,7-dioic acid aldolase [Acetobacter tropicalis]MBC9007220.1 4-hydroxy-2-oxoheptanedioate aldolase [Acetobacter tropicalis]MDO8171407.1 4-hydroxy-2-oxoheptanedioate aldolase [Acetobacter tropicalis]